MSDDTFLNERIYPLQRSFNNVKYRREANMKYLSREGTAQ